VSAQFYVDNENQLSCHLYQRSCDMFLGVPFNILSYSVLTHLLAKRNHYKPGYLIISTGDTHIYKDHVDQVRMQMTREPRSYPILVIDDSVITKSIDEITLDDFDLIGYFPHNTIRGKMSV
jgi:thymidylate synthase